MALVSRSRRTAGYKPYFAWYCCFALLWTLFLLYAGGFTTSIQAGMAFLDWPLSNGSVNPDGWLTDRDMRAEHSHRLLGTKVGLLTLGIFIWAMAREARPFVRRLSGAAVIAVILQGLLGGARVKFDQLNLLTDNNVIAQSFAIAHACLAQIFLCILVTIAVCASRPWIERQAAGARDPLPGKLTALGLATCGALFFQLLIGAIVRHNHAALAIPTFPWSTPTGGILPHAWTFPISIHFAHRVGAVIVTILLLAFVWRIFRAADAGRGIKTIAGAAAGLVAVQIALGALTVLTLKNEYVATIHMLTGAFLLAVTWLLTFISFRFPATREGTVLPQTESPQLDSGTSHARA